MARPHDLKLKNRTLLISMLPNESSNIALIPFTKTGSQRNSEIHKIEKQENVEIFLVFWQRMKIVVNRTPVWLTSNNVGLEATTLRLRVSCSTNWASRAFIARACIFWNRSQQYLLEISKRLLKQTEKLCPVWVSYSGPLDYETNALPTALTGQQRSKSTYFRYFRKLL